MGNVTSVEIQPVLIECRACRGPVWTPPPLAVDADAKPGQPSIRIRSRADIPDAVTLRVDRCLACTDGGLVLAGYAERSAWIRQLAGLNHGGAYGTLQLIAQWFAGSNLARLPRETSVTLETWAMWCHADPLMAGGELLPDLPLSVWLPDPHDGPCYALVGVAEVWAIEGVPGVLVDLPAVDGSGGRQSRLLPAEGTGTVAYDDEARLRACAELLRPTRRRGRPRGSTSVTLGQIEEAITALRNERGKQPSQEDVAELLGIDDRTVRRRMRGHWEDLVRGPA